MGCNSCHNTNTTCNCVKRCVTKDCSCPVTIKSDCVNEVTVDLNCLGIEAGQTLNEVLTALDQGICDKFNSISLFFTLINVGGGSQIYKGVDNLGRKEIRTLLGSSLIALEHGTDEITISVDEEAMNTYIQANQLTYTALSLGTGGAIYKDTSTAGNNTQFNFRSFIAQSQGAGEGLLRDVQENDDDITVRIKSIKSNTLNITSSDTEISIEQPSAATISGLFVNNLYVPTYEDFLNPHNLGKGEGTFARPFTDTVTYADANASPVITPNTAIQNALTGNAIKSYVGTGTPAAPERAGQTIIIQDNGGSYTFPGHFNYSGIQLKLEGSIVSTTSGFVFDADDATFNPDSTYTAIEIAEGKVFEVQGDGFNNTGNTAATSNYASGKVVVMNGKGLIYSAVNDTTKYIFNSDPDGTSNAGTGSNNDGNLTFTVNCDVKADYQGIYAVGGKSKIDFYGTLSSGLITGPTVDTSLKAFHQTGGQVRMVSTARLVLYGGTRTDGITFTPVAPFTPVFIGTGVAITGSATNLFTKTTPAKVGLEVSNSPSGYGLIIDNVFNSPSLWEVVFKNNVLTSGNIDNTVADLTKGNTISVTNFLGGNIIESLSTYVSRESARLNIPRGSAFMLRKVVNAVDLVAGEEYKVLTSGSPTLGTVGTYFTATGSETGTGTAYYSRRDTLL